MRLLKEWTEGRRYLVVNVPARAQAVTSSDAMATDGIALQALST